MRVRRIAAEQAHAIPARAYDVSFGSDAEIGRSVLARSLTTSSALVDTPGGLDEGGGTIPEGSTAQNGFREVKWFRCNECSGVVRETHLESHTCKES